MRPNAARAEGGLTHKKNETQINESALLGTCKREVFHRRLAAHLADFEFHSTHDTAAVRFPRLFVEHFGLSAQVVRSVHKLIQPYTPLKHIVDRSVLRVRTVQEHRGGGSINTTTKRGLAIRWFLSAPG